MHPFFNSALSHQDYLRQSETYEKGHPSQIRGVSEEHRERNWKLTPGEVGIAISALQMAAAESDLRGYTVQANDFRIVWQRLQKQTADTLQSVVQ